MNGVIVINKQPDWTSNDVVCKLRGILHERRVGHGGTLDPMAVGVLPVFVGRATRAAFLCENADKQYIAGMACGIVTDTQDTTGNIIQSGGKKPSRRALEEILPEFIGTQYQIPPMYSAVKIGGKKLYELARKGVEVERAPREITISELEIQEETESGFTLRAVCSKGTYIRTLCHDIGARLGCGAAMSSLCRTRAGAFAIDSALLISQVEEAMRKADMSFLQPVDSLFAELPTFVATPQQEAKCRCGAAFPAEFHKAGRVRVYSESGEFLMLGEFDGKLLKTVKSFFEV